MCAEHEERRIESYLGIGLPDLMLLLIHVIPFHSYTVHGHHAAADDAAAAVTAEHVCYQLPPLSPDVCRCRPFG